MQNQSQNQKHSPPVGILDSAVSSAGFRLQHLSVWNWGTFGTRVWTVTPDGSTSLLTGANGSGKSTLVDALLTLLVPNTRRSYNQASGADKKRERDEKTYVLGAYGRVRSEDTQQGPTARTQYLRSSSDYSVLLACFLNEATGQHITLAQVFWIHDGSVNKFFVVARDKLSIEQHFSHFDDISTLKKRLKQTPGIEVDDRFVEYSKKFRRLFGLQSEKALDLFNQTVTIKEIGALNSFVRNHMLEKSDSRARIAELRQNYDNLTRSYEAMRQAEEQLAKLRPLLCEIERFEEQAHAIEQLEQEAQAVPDYFARQTLALLDRATSETAEQLNEVRNRLETIGSDLEQARETQLDLHVMINSDEIEQRVHQLEQQMKEIERWMSKRKRQAESYTTLATSLNLPPYSDEHIFRQSWQRAHDRIPQIDAALHKLHDRLVEQQMERERLQARVSDIAEEIKSLRQRASQIPTQNLKLRVRILDALDLPEEEMPFVGELLQVKPEEREWEGAIERLLRPFGLRLLVPEKHYRRVNHYINETHLNGRIVFERVEEQHTFVPTRYPGPSSVVRKLAIKPGSAFADWLTSELIRQYDYVCCTSLDQFQREHRAITRNGLIRSGRSRHEKDDRRSLDDRRDFILGWSNQDKTTLLEEELAALASQLSEVNERIQAIAAREQEQREEQHRLKRFLDYQDFAELDWKADERDYHALLAQKQQLEQSSDRHQQLRQQYDAVSKQVASQRQAQEAAQKEHTLLEELIRQYQQRRTVCVSRLLNLSPEETQTCGQRIAEMMGDAPVALETVDRLERQVQMIYQERIKQERETAARLESGVVRAMANYKRDYPTETAEVDASVQSIPQFRHMLDAIEREDLPRHIERFKALLDEKVITDIAFFKQGLENQVDEIRANVATLNQSLQRIDYTASTYIQLQAEPETDVEVKEFRQALVACLPDVGQSGDQTHEANEASFHKIKALIERFDADDRWTMKVTDVRNWLNFSAVELFKADNRQKEYYSDSSGKSGGQKAKLAYTILASAIAYQFGLNNGESGDTSFRFVVVDEAFSKTDDTNARYAMELFKQLHLQLLVVTPSDKIHIVQPYISTCHFVHNNAEGSESKVYNIPIERIGALGSERNGEGGDNGIEAASATTSHSCPL